MVYLDGGGRGKGFREFERRLGRWIEHRPKEHRTYHIFDISSYQPFNLTTFLVQYEKL
jgi:hypothetical protein